MVENIIFNILTISGMVFNIGTSKGQEPNIKIDQAPQVATLKANHTYTFDLDNFVLDNQTALLEPNENDILVIKVSSAIHDNNEYVNPLLDNYVGFEVSIDSIDMAHLLYFGNNIIYLTENSYDAHLIEQFTVIELITYTQGNLLSIYPYLTDITQGGQIISSIGSGLGLIGHLTNEFLTGFTNLFWQNETLTSFGGFALVMLGVSVSFAVVKLVLFIIRNKSGR
ncbi:MAG: hypothetical protein WC248_07690 [Candidatus Methanomethylophilaceae archaeon]|jgi:hypothetical protein